MRRWKRRRWCWKGKEKKKDDYDDTENKKEKKNRKKEEETIKMKKKETLTINWPSVTIEYHTRRGGRRKSEVEGKKIIIKKMVECTINCTGKEEVIPVRAPPPTSHLKDILLFSLIETLKGT